MDPVTPQPKPLSARARKAEIERRLYNAYWRRWESVRIVYIFTPPGIGLKDPLPPIPRPNGQHQEGGIRQADGSVLWAQFLAPHYNFKQGLDDPVFEPAFRNAIPAGLWGGDFAPMGFPKEKITSFDMLRHIYKACQPKWAKPMMTQEEAELLPEELQELSGPLNPNGYDDQISLPMIVWRIREADPTSAEVIATRESIQYVYIPFQQREDKSLTWQSRGVPTDWRAWRVELEIGMGPHPGEPAFWLAFAKSRKGDLDYRSPNSWLNSAVVKLNRLPFGDGPMIVQLRPGSDQCVYLSSKLDGAGVSDSYTRLLSSDGSYFDPADANALLNWRYTERTVEARRLIPERVYGWIDYPYHRGWHGRYIATRPLARSDETGSSKPYLLDFNHRFTQRTSLWVKWLEPDHATLALEEDDLSANVYTFVLERPAVDATLAT